MNSIRFLHRFSYRMASFGYNERECRALSALIESREDRSTLVDINSLVNTLGIKCDD